MKRRIFAALALIGVSAGAAWAYQGASGFLQIHNHQSTTDGGTLSNQSPGILAAGSLGPNVIASSEAVNSVGTPQLAALAVTTAKIAANAVTAAKLDVTGAAAGTCGSTTQICTPVFTTDGRVTSWSNTTISGSITTQWTSAGSDIYYTGGGTAMGTSATNSAAAVAQSTSASAQRGLDVRNSSSQSGLEVNNTNGVVASSATVLIHGPRAAGTSTGYDMSGKGLVVVENVDNGLASANDSAAALSVQALTSGGATQTGRVFEVKGTTSTSTTSRPDVFYVRETGQTFIGGGIQTHSYTAPQIACNAGSPSIQSYSSNTAGRFTAGSAAANCTVTFGVTAGVNDYANSPICFCNDETTTQVLKATTNTTTVVCTAAATMSGDVISYLCFGAK